MQTTATRNASAAAVSETLTTRNFVIFQLHQQPKVAIRAEGLDRYTTLRQRSDGTWDEVSCLYSWAVFNAVVVDVRDMYA